MAPTAPKMLMASDRFSPYSDLSEWLSVAGHSKGGDTVVTYAGTYDDIPKVVNVSGRFHLERGNALVYLLHMHRLASYVSSCVWVGRRNCVGASGFAQIWAVVSGRTCLGYMHLCC